MNVLISSASRKVSLLRAFQQALAQEGGGKVIAVDSAPFAPALYLADEHYLVPPSDHPAFGEVMRELCGRLGVTLIIPTRDEELPWFAEYRESFGEMGTVVMVSDPATVELCQNKRLFIQFCRARGLGIPETCDSPEDLGGDLRFPVFVKPERGKGGWQATLVRSRAELQLLLERMPRAIVQEFVLAPEYTMDVFVDFDGNVISVVPRERIAVVAGESFVSRTSSNRVLIEAGVRLAGEMKLIGHNTIQCFLDGETVKFVEVNPRFGGGAHLGFAAGVPTPLFLVKLVKGEPVEPRIGAFKDNYTMLRYTEDLFIDGEALTSRRLA